MDPSNPSPLLPAGAPVKSYRLARWLNVFLPGAGLFYFGQRVAGSLLAISFLGCLLATLAIFLTSYLRYFSLAMSEDLLKGDRLERLNGLFHPYWLIGLAVAGLAIYLTSMLLLWRAQWNQRSKKLPF